MRPLKLVYEDSKGAGMQIRAFIPRSLECVEFRLKPGYQCVLDNVKHFQAIVGVEPWIQFSPQDWDDMIEQLYKEMVDAWNEKYAIKEDPV